MLDEIIELSEFILLWRANRKRTLDEFIHCTVKDSMEQSGNKTAGGGIFANLRTIDESAAFEPMFNEIFLFHGAQERLHGVLNDTELVAELFIDFADGGFFSVPEDLEDFQFPIRWIRVAVHVGNSFALK